MTLKGKKILLLVTGSVAVYKAVEFIRLLQKNGGEVQVACSESALKFVSELTFSAISKNPVLTDLKWWQESSQITHVKAAKWADLVIILPATSNTIAKLNAGIVDNLLTAIWSSIPQKTSKIIAPAMDLDMAINPVFQKNIASLESLHSNLKILSFQEGYLASGLSGRGRLCDLNIIFKAVESLILVSDLQTLDPKFQNSKIFKSPKKVLITAGGTREKIDPVRFLTNGSTGKMGYELAWIFWAAGLEVVLISSSKNESFLDSNNLFKTIKVDSAKEMLEEFKNNFADSDLVVCSAAVADYSPKKTNLQKIKKSSEILNLELEKTVDILAWAGEEKFLKKLNSKIIAGFALETGNLEENCLSKIKNKKVDWIFGNYLTQKTGFGDETEIFAFSKDNFQQKINSKNKSLIALEIFKILALG